MEIRSPTSSASVLELRCSQSQVHEVRELILQAPTNIRAYGTFIPSTFLVEEPTAVYNTAVKHTKYLQGLKAIPVSGIHTSLLQQPVEHLHDDRNVPFFPYIFNIKTPPQADAPQDYIFQGIEASQMTQKTGKWYFLTTDTSTPCNL